MNFRSILSFIAQINFPVADVPFQLLIALPSPVIINAKNPYIIINKLTARAITIIKVRENDD